VVTRRGSRERRDYRASPCRDPRLPSGRSVGLVAAPRRSARRPARLSSSLERRGARTTANRQSPSRWVPRSKIERPPFPGSAPSHAAGRAQGQTRHGICWVRRTGRLGSRLGRPERHPCHMLAAPFGPNRQRKGRTEWQGFCSGSSSKPEHPLIRRRSVVLGPPSWSPGQTIHLGRRTLRVVAVRDDDADSPPVLVMEDLAQ
jgi:hypothetical protein